MKVYIMAICVYIVMAVIAMLLGRLVANILIKFEE
jgi:hypothetical protein